MMKLVKETLYEGVLNEIGEASVEPYKWKRITRAGVYEFKTEDNDKYIVHFYSPDDDDVWHLDFLISGLKLGINLYSYVSNKGRMFRVLSTVLDIVKHKVNKDKRKKIRIIIISPEKNYEHDDRRYKIYKRFIEKNLPNDWELQEYNVRGKVSFYIKRKEI